MGRADGPPYTTLALVRTPWRLDVHLRRPEVRNAFNDVLIDELTAVLRAAAADDLLRCLVLSGEGPVFCAGADLEWMRRAAAYGAEENLRDARRMAALFRTLAELPFPSVAIVRGAALGGGSGLVACTDIALADEDTKLGFTEVRLGIAPAVISAFVLRKIGRGHALRYFQTGEIFDARRAAAIGLVSEAVPAGRLEARAEEVVAQILAAGPRAVREARRVVDLVAGTPYPRVLDDAAELIARLRSTEEAREGMAAFLAKRKPSWTEEPQ